MKPFISKENLIRFDQLSLLALAFLLPLEKRLVVYLIALMVFRWLIGGQFLNILPALKKGGRKVFLLFFALFYVLHIIGLLNTADMSSGLFDLEVKFSLLIFPVLFITLDARVLDQKWINRILLAFVFGSVLSMLISFGVSGWAYLREGDSSVFYYSDVSFFHHVAYMAMYLDFATVICLYFLIERRSSLNRISRWGLLLAILFFMFSVVLLSSKAGLLGMILVLFFAMIYLIIRQKMILHGVLGFIFSVTVFYAFSILFPYSQQRIQRATDAVEQRTELDKKSAESTTERILVWQSALELVGNNFFTGVGTGDVVDELVAVYERDGIEAAAEDRLNAHNQVLQTQLGLGIIGTISLLLILLLPLLEGFRKDHFVYVLFLLLFGFNILFESMLQTQSGVIFYAFFNAFLFTTRDE